jgi:hypothetical protein
MDQYLIPSKRQVSRLRTLIKLFLMWRMHAISLNALIVQHHSFMVSPNQGAVIGVTCWILVL